MDNNIVKKNVIKNYIYNLLYQILIIITPIITTPYIARVLGPGGNGIYAYTISIVTYFVLFGSIGINLYGQREIAYVQNNKEKRSIVFSELFILITCTMTISIIIYYLFFCIKGEYSLYFKLLLFELIGSLLDVSWLYSGLEQFKTISLRNIIIKIISVVLILLFVKDKKDVNIYVFIYAFMLFISNVSLWFNLKKYVKLKIKNINIKKHIKPIFILFLPQIATQIYAVLDKTMMGNILNDMNEIGYYDQAQKIIRILLTLITSIVTVMAPRIAKEFADNNKENIKFYMNETFNFVLMLAYPLIFGIIAVSDLFVPIFFGIGYDKVTTIMNLMSIIIIFIGLSNVIGIQYLIPLKRTNECTISVIGGAIVNILFNVIFIYKLKAIGATIATIIAEIVVLVIQIYFIRKEFNLKQILLMSIKYFFSGIIMFVICKFVGIYFVNEMVCISLQIIVGMISYFGILILLKDEFLLKYIKKLFKKIKFFKPNFL